MDYTARFPLYVSLDDYEVMRIESSGEILGHLETIDIENDEYLFWDADGRGLKVLIKKRRVSGIEAAHHRITLQQAFDRYARQLAQLGVVVDTSGTIEEIWAKIQKAKERLPRRSFLPSWLFRKGRN
jgi:hypothetical protein